MTILSSLGICRVDNEEQHFIYGLTSIQYVLTNVYLIISLLECIPRVCSCPAFLISEQEATRASEYCCSRPTFHKNGYFCKKRIYFATVCCLTCKSNASCTKKYTLQRQHRSGAGRESASLPYSNLPRSCNTCPVARGGARKGI